MDDKDKKAAPNPKPAPQPTPPPPKNEAMSVMARLVDEVFAARNKLRANAATPEAPFLAEDFEHSARRLGILLNTAKIEANTIIIQKAGNAIIVCQRREGGIWSVIPAEGPELAVINLPEVKE